MTKAKLSAKAKRGKTRYGTANEKKTTKQEDKRIKGIIKVTELEERFHLAIEVVAKKLNIKNWCAAAYINHEKEHAQSVIQSFSGKKVEALYAVSMLKNGIMSAANR